MLTESGKSRLVLKLIGVLFTLISIALIALILWISPALFDAAQNTEFNGFFTSALILAFTTFTISIFIWWIVFNNKFFVVKD
ncbi:MAG: hypothetical protein IPP71_12120 [Bacteroidetes bacterium]|nr:hypothetical protein [Bacteroidota bacterium]